LSDRAVLLALAKSGHHQIGRNPVCDVKLWNFVRYHRDERVQEAALEHNEVLSPNLRRHPDPETRRRVAANPRCSPGLLVSLGEGEPSIRAAVARNPKTPPGTLSHLARDRNLWVRIGVASNPSCPSEAYRLLRSDRVASVRSALVLNPTVPRTIVAERVFNDTAPSVHVALASRVDLCSRHLVWLERYSRRHPQREYKLVRARLAQHPACSSRLERRLAQIDARLAAMGDLERGRYERALRLASSPLWCAMIWGVGLPSAFIPYAMGALGIAMAKGADFAPGLTIAVFGCGLSVVESAIAAGICLQNTPFLTRRPPRLGTANAALPLQQPLFSSLC
jgi:hypothetical protein